VTGAEAYFLGLADRLVDVSEIEGDGVGDGGKGKEGREAVLNEAIRMAKDICEGGPVAIRMALRAVGDPREEVENACYERVVVTEDRNEALKAFGEKRRPVFKGR